MMRIDYNQRAECLAKDLLGKVICYKKSETETVRYMITVTEAYPADDPYSYVNREKSSFGHNCLLKEEKNAGDCFVNYNGIHILGRRDNDSRKFDHVLIRGAIKVTDDNRLKVDKNTKLNFVYGAPCVLCDRLNLELKGQNSFSLTDDSATLQIKKQPNEPKNVFSAERYNLPIPREIKNCDDKYTDTEYYIAPLRFYFIPNIDLFTKQEND